MLKPEELHLTQEWDKTFAKSDRVDHKKVTFINRFGLTLAADQYTPKDAQGRLAGVPAIPPPRTSTPRTSRQRWISSLFRTA